MYGRSTSINSTCRRAALYVCGRIVVGKSHMDALEQIPEEERDHDHMVSGFFDPETHEFTSYMAEDHFYDKSMYLVRHGRSIDPENPDPDISDDGMEQVERSASLLRREDVDGFVGITSPMLRCLRTASILHRMLGIHFMIVPEVMETPSFVKEGEVFKLHNRSQQFPQFEWPTSKEWHVLPETPGDFAERVKETLQSLPSKSILVTHQGFICLMVDLALCKERANFLCEMGVPPASVTYIHRQDVLRLGMGHNETVLQD